MLGALLELAATVLGGSVGVDRPSAGSADAISSLEGGVVLGRFLEGPIKISYEVVFVLRTAKERLFRSVMNECELAA